MNKALLMGFVALLLLPFVFSFDCSLVDDVNACKEIKVSTLPNSEKNELFSLLLHPESSIPNHQVIKDYNDKVKVTGHNPKYSSKYIKNAWVKLSSLSPSVQELVPPVTIATSHSNHDVTLPPSYNAGKYPQTSGDDCKRISALDSGDSKLSYYVNGVPQSNPLFISSNGIVETAYSVHVTVRTEHYKWKKYWFVKLCRYSHTTYDQDSLTVKDSKKVILYNKKPSVYVKTLDIYGNTLRGEYSAKDQSYLLLNFKDSSLVEKKYSYSVVFDEDYIATLKVTPVNETIQENLVVKGKEFYLHNTKECEYKAVNHFFSKDGDCNLQKVVKETKSLESI